MNDLYPIIASHLCYIDLLSWTIAVPCIKPYIKLVDFNDIILKRLNQLGLDGQSFIDHLIKYNNYVSGSFILQCLYNMEWPSDIDVYCMSEDTYLPNLNKSPLGFIKFLKDATLVEPGSSYELMHFYQRMYTQNNVMINHIMVNPTPIDDLHHDTIFKFVDLFDLDFCKVIYDGKKLYIKNLDSLFSRSSVLNVKMDIYIKKAMLKENQDKVYGRLLQRVIKYKSRGFKIEI